MKKKEIVIVVAVVVICLCAVFGIRIWNEKKEADIDPNAVPQETPVGEWVAVVHRNGVELWFDSGVDGEYTVTGDYGDMTIEVLDGRWHVEEVECPNQNCYQMGWDDGTSFMPITCIPNNIFIATSTWVEGYLDTAE